MDALLEFLADNYKYLMIGAVVLLFALIGFIVDGKKKKKKEEVVPIDQNQSNMDMQTNMVNTPVASSQVDMLTTPEVPSDEPSLVFESPSLSTNSTINEINGVDGNTPSMSFDTDSLNGEGKIAPTESESVTFGEPISVESNPVNFDTQETSVSSIEESPVVMEAPVETIQEIPVETAPVIEESPVVMEAPVEMIQEMPVETAPVIEESPVVMEAPVETIQEMPVETAPVIEEAPMVMETPVEMIQEMPVETAPVIEEVPVVMEAPVEMIQEMPVETAPVIEESPVVPQIDIVEAPVMETPVDNNGII